MSEREAAVADAPAAKHMIEVTKVSKKRLNPEKIIDQVDKIITRAVGGGRLQKGWKVVIANEGWKRPRLRGDQYEYLCQLSATCTPKRPRTPEAMKQDLDNMIKVIGAAGQGPGWQISLIDGRVAVAGEDRRLPGPVGYVPVEIPTNWRDAFSHIYERDAQIEIIMSAIEAGIKSDFYDRFHLALIGDPACGKTEVLRTIKTILGEEAVLEYDATATTQAGAIQDLDNREVLPRILLVEEIEKTDETSLRWLLGVMDQRAEIRKVTARTSIQRETRMLTLATVNDYKLFRKIMFGALESRFTYHLHFPRPDRALLKKILEREIARVRGDKRWIKPTLDYAESEKIYDPRKVKAICLCGRDDLLSGEYQTKLKACAASKFLAELDKRQRKERPE